MQDTGPGTGHGHTAQVRRLADQFAQLCRELDPDALPADLVTTMHQALTRVIDTATGARTRIARRVAELPRSELGGHLGPVEYLAGTSGRPIGQVRAEVKLSADLAALPGLDAALAAGALSADQSSAIAPGAIANPDVAAALVSQATSGQSDLADLRRRARQAVADADPDPDATRARHHRRRSVRTWVDPDGEWNARLRGPAESGAAILAAIQPATDRAFRTARRDGRREGADAYAFDGLVNTLTVAAPLGSAASGKASSPPTPEPDAPPTPDPDAPPTPDPNPPPTRDPDATPTPEPDATPTPEPDATPMRTPALPRGRQAKVIGIIDVNALARGRAAPGETCHLAGVGPVSVSAIQDLLGHATAALVFRRGTKDLAVAHLGRQPTAFQRTALEARDYVCAVVGCGHVHNLEIDHTTEWASSRQTHIDDLDWLCPAHHRAKTTGQLTLGGQPGRRRARASSAGPSP